MSTKTTAKVGQRVFFTEGDELPIPDLTAHQKDSFEDFVKSGLREVFNELNPIEDYTGTRFSLSFRDYKFGEPKMSVEDAKYNMSTYEAPLHVTVELQNKVTSPLIKSALQITTAQRLFLVVVHGSSSKQHKTVVSQLRSTAVARFQ